MTITASDLKLFAAAYPNDTPAGGGPMTATVVQTATENNVFPDVDAAARASGRVQLRKVFAAVTSGNADAVMAAQVSFASGSSDPGVDVIAFPEVDRNGVHYPFRNYALGPVEEPFDFSPNLDSFVTQAPDHLNQFGYPGAALVVPEIGDLVGFSVNASGHPGFVTWITAKQGDSSQGWTLSMADSVRLPSQTYLFIKNSHAQPATRIIGTAKTAAVAAGVYTVAVDRVLARLVPVPLRPDGVRDGHYSYPDSATGLGPAENLRPIGGLVPIFRKGDSVVIRSGAISEVAVVVGINYVGGLTFQSPLANSYPAGSTVCALLDLGDMQAAVGQPFTQQTWTRAWADSILGNPIGLAYDMVAGSLSITNAGAETERWAIVFTSATAYNLIGETRGQIASGTTTTAFAPLNPITGAPYFTIAKEGWGTGWAIGNVLRFNTTGARAAIWLARCVSPSAAGALNTPSLEIRGTVNA